MEILPLNSIITPSCLFWMLYNLINNFQRLMGACCGAILELPWIICDRFFCEKKLLISDWFPLVMGERLSAAKSSWLRGAASFSKFNQREIFSRTKACRWAQKRHQQKQNARNYIMHSQTRRHARSSVEQIDWALVRATADGGYQLIAKLSRERNWRVAW